jgi:hypothetical protein
MRRIKVGSLVSFDGLRDKLVFSNSLEARPAKSLLAAGLVDELDFAVHPLILGLEKPLQLVSAQARRNGVVSIKVRP